MIEQLDAARIVGIGVVTKWDPAKLDAKLAFERELIRDGLEGAALEKAALEMAARIGADPYDVAESHNTLVNSGTNAMLLGLTGGAITGGSFNNANSALGVGDSAAAFALTQANLQGAVNNTDRIRVAMNATYPSVAGNVATFQATFATGQANFTWNEWALFNNVTDGLGTMLNRAVANLGTKTNAAAWQLTVTLTQS